MFVLEKFAVHSNPAQSSQKKQRIQQLSPVIDHCLKKGTSFHRLRREKNKLEKGCQPTDLGLLLRSTQTRGLVLAQRMVQVAQPARRPKAADVGDVCGVVKRSLPLARPENRNTITQSVANPPPEEPDAAVPHVRVSEGASGQPLALLGGCKWLTKNPRTLRPRNSVIET